MAATTNNTVLPSTSSSLIRLLDKNVLRPQPL